MERWQCTQSNSITENAGQNLLESMACKFLVPEASGEVMLCTIINDGLKNTKPIL